MPTNIYRNRSVGERARSGRTISDARAAGDVRVIKMTVGPAVIHAQLAETPTALRIWQALPVFSVVETWGEVLHFETHMRSSRDASARMNARVGDIYFWPSDERIILPFGPSPISRLGEIRLPEPCNVIAHSTEVLDALDVLKALTPGEKVSLVVDAD